METNEKKDAYRKKIEAQIEEWDAQIDVLKARAKKAGAEMQLKLERQIEELKARREDVRGHLAELHKAGDDAWHKVREGLDKALGEFKGAWDKIKERF
ncbi:hypothetical protein [Geoalkalibacter sp.]|uniref:hypothetical protein n=1 Tax=Geoalkalibacter sp. TaxID=3041440 RepID=UPI00272E18D8|nr:hypothetical protein [Geoalkalibacter sp.]